MARWKVCASRTFEILPFSTCTVCQQSPIFPKVFNRFSKSLPPLEDAESGHLGAKFQFRRYLTLAMARRKFCASTTFEILPLSTCTLWQQKSYTSKGIQPIFEIFAWDGRCCGWAFGWKVSSAQVFYFCNGKVKTLGIDNIWNFATFSLYTVARKNPTPPKVFIRFSKSSPELEDFEGGHLGGKFQVRRCFTFAMARWKLWASTTFEICHFQPVHCASKIPYLQKYSTDIRNLCLRSKIESGHLGGIFQVRRYFTFAIARRNFAHRQNLKFCHFQLVHCGSKNHTPQRCSSDLRNLCLRWKMLRVGIWVESFKGRRCFTFAMARWKFCGSRTFEFGHFQLVHCASKNPISPMVFNRFSKSFPELEDVEGGHLGGNFQVRRCFTSGMARRKLCASTKFEILPLPTCTLRQQKSYISKGIQPIFEIFASARRCLGWSFGWKVCGAEVFYFCNGKAKTLRMDKIWNFATFNL